MNTFTAGVQYNDMKGTVAADRSDNLSFLQFLKDEKVANEGELLVGFRFGFYGNDSQDIDVSSIVVYLYEANEFDAKPKKVRAVETEIPISKLFSFFKRFDLIVHNKGMDLSDAEVDGPHYD